MRTRLTVALIAGISFFGLLVAWAFASPVGSSADEDFHLTSIWCAWGDHETCITNESSIVVQVPQQVAEANCMALENKINARCTWLLTNDLVETSRLNPSSGYNPPLFYSAMRTFVGPDVARSVLIMRMANAAIAAALLAVALAVAPTVLRRGAAVVWAVSIIPVGAFFIASANPSSWAITGVGFFWVFTWAVIRIPAGHGGRRSIAAAGSVLSLVLAMGARVDTVFAIALTLLALMALEFRRIKRHVAPLAAAIGLVAVLAAIGAFAWIFRVGEILRNFSLTFPPGNASTDQPNPLVKTLLELPAFIAGLFGGQQPWTQRESVNDWGAAGYTWHGFTYGVGAVDVINPSIAAVLVGASVAAVVFLGIGRGSRVKLLVLASLGAAFVAQVILVRASVGFGAWWSTGNEGGALQPRYFLPLAMVIVAFAVVSFPGRRTVMTRAQAALLATALSIAAVTSLMATMARYVHGQDRSWLQFVPEDGWWWSWGPSPTAFIVLGGVASTVYMVTLAYASRETLTRGPARTPAGKHAR